MASVMGNQCEQENLKLRQCQSQAQSETTSRHLSVLPTLAKALQACTWGPLDLGHVLSAL